MKFNSDYFKLFVRREGAVVLGRGYSNLWLLILVLTATFLAIAFSNGSLRYLDYKMNDPFINWVEIPNLSGDGEGSDFEGLIEELSFDMTADEYHINGYQQDFEFYFFFFGREEGQQDFMKCRFFGSMNTKLVEAILAEDNVVDGCAVTDIRSLEGPEWYNRTVGVIITEDAIKRLGYTSPYPAYIDLYSYSPGAELMGIDTYEDRARAPMPVLGVVRKLPGNADVISSTFFYCQKSCSAKPFNLAKEEYASSLYYFIPDDVDKDEFGALGSEAIAAADTLAFTYDVYSVYFPEQISWKMQQNKGSFVGFYPEDGQFSFQTAKAVNDALMAEFGDRDVHRLYMYRPFFYENAALNEPSHLSVHFNDLNKIRDFESFAKREYKVKIEMSQINAKDNFNAVRLLANILSWAMIGFAIVCIILFIVNLLQSYFQKVKRNLGTFKAFGISNSELMSIYMLIMAAMVLTAIAAALAVVSFAQLLLPLFGLVKEGSFNYLSLWNGMTLWSVLIIIAASIFTVYRVMTRLLRQTPGDLIYDRE